MSMTVTQVNSSLGAALDMSDPLAFLVVEKVIKEQSKLRVDAITPLDYLFRGKRHQHQREMASYDEVCRICDAMWAQLVTRMLQLQNDVTMYALELPFQRKKRHDRHIDELQELDYKLEKRLRQYENDLIFEMKTRPAKLQLKQLRHYDQILDLRLAMSLRRHGYVEEFEFNQFTRPYQTTERNQVERDVIEQMRRDLRLRREGYDIETQEQADLIAQSARRLEFYEKSKVLHQVQSADSLKQEIERIRQLNDESIRARKKDFDDVDLPRGKAAFDAEMAQKKAEYAFNIRMKEIDAELQRAAMMFGMDPNDPAYRAAREAEGQKVWDAYLRDIDNSNEDDDMKHLRRQAVAKARAGR